ncbi:MAG: hypothetical protein JWP66_1613 [Naasia sp.]|nr:hypothetical protein [Naasia sp.]
MSDTIPDGGAYDDEAVSAQGKQTVTNDAVAGETVLPGSGEGNDGPTGGAPNEGRPVYHGGGSASDEVEDIPGLRTEGPNGPVKESHA